MNGSTSSRVFASLRAFRILITSAVTISESPRNQPLGPSKAEKSFFSTPTPFFNSTPDPSLGFCVSFEIIITIIINGMMIPNSRIQSHELERLFVPQTSSRGLSSSASCFRRRNCSATSTCCSPSSFCIPKSRSFPFSKTLLAETEPSLLRRFLRTLRRLRTIPSGTFSTGFFDSSSLIF